MNRPMPEPPEKYQLLGPTVVVWEGGAGYYYHPSLTDAKRLTDAECAAEKWRALTVQLITPYNAPWGSRREEGLRADTWHRFATLPHALEVNA